jgi:hypothetical protein
VPPAATRKELLLDSLPGSHGVKTEVGFRGSPDDEGVLRIYDVVVPPYTHACYYANYQKYDVAEPDSANWPQGGNRIQALQVADFANLKRGGMQLLLRLADGRCMVILPLVGTDVFCWFESRDGGLALMLGNMGTGAVSGDMPLLAWAAAEDPYEAFRIVWRTAITAIGGATRLRGEKRYPEIFRYLGWCSWEEYLENIDGPLLVKAAQDIERSGLPIRFLLVDDGHLDHEGSRLLDFAPNSKFPEGWKELLDMRKPEKIRWMGLWLNFNGYWKGMHPQNRLGALNEHLMPVKSGASLVPKHGMLHSFAFYDVMIGAARKAGFDFVKVDNQAGNLANYQGTKQPVACAAMNAQALEVACARHMDGLINCMAHNAVCIMNTRISAVTRCSEDYKVNNLPRARRHIHNSYANMPWMGQTVWGDHDMFHSADPVCGGPMAVSKALSGAPIYLSDAPTRFAAENVVPLCYADGELLRPRAPAVPLPDSLFLDPFAVGKPFRVIAPLSGGAAAIAVYNLSEPEVSVDGYVCAEDYTHAGVLIQPELERWRIPNEGILCYEWGSGEAALLAHREFPIAKFDHRFFLLCPVKAGWAVIGRSDKFLSPAAVDVVHAQPDRLQLRMRETGPLRIWRYDGRVSSSAAAFREIARGLWHADLPVGERDKFVEVTCR